MSYFNDIFIEIDGEYLDNAKKYLESHENVLREPDSVLIGDRVLMSWWRCNWHPREGELRDMMEKDMKIPETGYFCERFGEEEWDYEHVGKGLCSYWLKRVPVFLG